MDWTNEFEDAIWRWPGRGPHAKYRLSSHHADFYFNTDVVAADGARLDRVAREGLAPRAGDVAWVVAPLTSLAASVLVGQAVARALGRPLAYYDVRDGRWSTPVPAGVSAVVVTDDVHGGGSARATVQSARAHGLEVRKILALANFSPHAALGEVPLTSLISPGVTTWAPGACPLCAAGSIAVDARAHWHDLRESKG